MTSLSIKKRATQRPPSQAQSIVVRLVVGGISSTFAEQHSEGIPGISIGVDPVRRIRKLPSKPHDAPRCDHILLRQVVDDLTTRILDNGLIQDFERDVLSQGPHELRPVTGDEKAFRWVNRTISGEDHIRTIKRVPGAILQACKEQGAPVSISKAPQFAPDCEGTNVSRHGVAVFFDLSNDTVLAEDLVVQIGTRAMRHRVVTSDRRRDNAARPRRGSRTTKCVGSVEYGRVKG